MSERTEVNRPHLEEFKVWLKSIGIKLVEDEEAYVPGVCSLKESQEKRLTLRIDLGELEELEEKGFSLMKALIEHLKVGILRELGNVQD